MSSDPAIGVWFGFPQADPVVGPVITAVIFKIVWSSGKSLFARLLDGVDPTEIEEVRHAARHVPQVLDVTEVRIRWLRHRLLAEINVAVQSDLSVEAGHEIAQEVRHQLLHRLPYLSNATIHGIRSMPRGSITTGSAVTTMTHYPTIHIR